MFMGKTRTAIKSKPQQLKLNLKVVATGVQNAVAATTTTSLGSIVDSAGVEEEILDIAAHYADSLGQK